MVVGDVAGRPIRVFGVSLAGTILAERHRELIEPLREQFVTLRVQFGSIDNASYGVGTLENLLGFFEQGCARVAPEPIRKGDATGLERALLVGAVVRSRHRD